MEPLGRCKESLLREKTPHPVKRIRSAVRNRRDRDRGVQALILCLFSLGLATACGPERQDGVTPLLLGQEVSLAFGRQRLLLPIDPAGHYHARLAPLPGDYALLVASVCTLDPHRRV